MRFHLVHKLFFVLLLFGFIFIAGCQMPNPQPDQDIPTDFPTPLPPSPSPETGDIPEGVMMARDTAVSYVINRNGGTAPSGAWVAEYITPEGLVGSSSYRFTAQDWLVTVTYPIVAPESVIYTVQVQNQAANFQWEGQVDPTGMVHEIAQPTEEPRPTDTATLPPATATPEPTEPDASDTPAPTTSTPTGDEEEDEEACANKARFVSDVTVPDNMRFLPGQTFTKTWRLRNTGDCTWTTDYALVFASGDRMSATSPIALKGEVEPDETMDLSVELVAPATDGTYKGNWMLQNADGEEFGLGDDAEDPFWVQIVVGEEDEDDDDEDEDDEALNLGTPSWTDSFDGASNWYLLDTDNTLFEIEDGQLIMTAEEPGLEEWGLSNRPALEDFYLEATVKTGDECSGLDRYGLLVRSPDPSEGYVFGFTCDGRYRLYKWDGENYTGLKEWTSSAYIFNGPDKTNRIGFWAEGNTIKLYANGNLLTELTDSTYDEGRFGLFIASANTDDLKFYVEEVKYWILD